MMRRRLMSAMSTSKVPASAPPGRRGLVPAEPKRLQRSAWALAVLAVLAVSAVSPRRAAAEAGVLIPVSLGSDPDPSKLSLRRVDIEVRIDHLHARVAMKQIFENHTDQPLEARYVLPLGERAGIEDFSVWDAEERLVGVVVEKQRGRRLFEQITAQKMDPGLAESEDDKDKGRQFALRVAPIPPRGTARVEVVYAEELAVSSGGAVFTLPLSPRRYGEQRAGEAHITLSLSGEWPLERASVAKDSPLKLKAPVKAGDKELRAEFHGRDVEFTHDATLELRYAAGGGLTTTLAYRDPTPRRDISPFGEGFVYKDSRGFFLLRTLFNGITGGAPVATAPVEDKPRDVVILLDTSLSMQWEKLERSFAAVEHFLSRLSPRDRFGLVLFGDEARPFKDGLSPSGAAPVGEALRFVRESYLVGGSDLGKAVAAGSGLLSRDAQAGRERFLVLISDGRPTRGELQPRALGRSIAQSMQQARGGGKPPVRLFILGVGDDAAVEVLRSLAEAGDGSFAWAREGAEAGFKLRTFFDKLGQATWKDVAMTVAGLAGIEQVLPSTAGQVVYAGSDVLFAGRYKTPGAGTATVAGKVAGQPISVSAKLNLPADDRARPWIARTWARLRIDELLARIAQDGEKDEWVQEIIALAKEFHLATPYTSFLAAPRALLRPRAIQPGDPVLRVKVSADIRAVTALFPFGLQKPLRYLPAEDLWETRFLAPSWMTDGAYRCTLVLTDREGHKQREEKSFVIDSKAPRITLRLPARAAARGQALAVVADADPDTRRLLARLGDGPSVELRWDAARKGSFGEVLVPPDVAPGVYSLTVTAEDFAHNVSATRADIVVLAAPDSGGKNLDGRSR